MPQELQVLQCFNCKYFQAHIVKKKPKWACKVCREKQSVKKIFMKSESGKECRLLVQELNLHHDDSHDVESTDTSNRENELDCPENNFETEGCKDDSVWNEFLQLEDDNHVNSQGCYETYSRNDGGLADELMLTSEQVTCSNTKRKNKLLFFETGDSIIASSDESEPVPKRSKSCPEPNVDISPIREEFLKTDSMKRPKHQKPVISMFEEGFSENDLKL